MTSSPGPVTAVVFDMGGVLVELGPLEEFLGMSMSGEEFWPRWLASPSVRRFERGESDALAFGQGLRDEFELDLMGEEIVERFRRFPRGLMPGAASLVAEVGGRVTTAVLSNTNQLHWDGQEDASILKSLFDHHFLSYELGAVKPDAVIFRRVVDALGCAPSEILFLDDNQVNVDGASAVGIQARRAVGVAEARAVLASLGLVAMAT